MGIPGLIQHGESREGLRACWGLSTASCRSSSGRQEEPPSPTNQRRWATAKLQAVLASLMDSVVDLASQVWWHSNLILAGASCLYLLQLRTTDKFPTFVLYAGGYCMGRLGAGKASAQRRFAGFFELWVLPGALMGHARLRAGIAKTSPLVKPGWRLSACWRVLTL